MKMRIVALILGLIMTLAWMVPALAESRNGVYILDEKEYLSESEWQVYQIQAKDLSNKLDMDILYVQTYHVDLQTDAQSLNLGSRSNQIMLLDNDGTCDIALFGTANALSQEHIRQLRDAYIVKPTYSEGVAAYLATAEQIVTDMKASGAFERYDAASQSASRIVDRANLLDASEEEALLLQLDEISQRQQLDVVVVTVNTLEGKSAMDYAEDFFHQNGYGFGPERDGILLLVSIEEMHGCIYTSGYGTTAFTAEGQDYFSDCVAPQLSEQAYANAFRTFAQKCDDFITQARTGESGHLPETSFPIGKCLLISLIVGVIAASGVVLYMKKQLKSLRAQDTVAANAKSTVPNLTVDKEIYLYSTTTSRSRSKAGSSLSHRSSTEGPYDSSENN